MFCQACGSPQNEESEFCTRCHQKLLVLSGGGGTEEASFESQPEENFSFDEHLLERISILEEVLKKTTDTVRSVLGLLQKQEKNVLINHTGLSTLAEELEARGVLARDQWNETWESRARSQLLTLEKRDRFANCRGRIAALYSGKRRSAFLQHLEEAEFALLCFDLDKAVGSLEAAWALDRANYELAYFLGEIFFNEGEADRALEYFSSVLMTREDHYDGLVYSGVILYERGEHEAARRFLERALQLYPDAFLPLFSLGAIAAASGELEKAVIFLRGAVEIDRVPQALYLLGNCYYELDQRGPAIEALREAVRLDPTFEEAHHLLGLAYLDRHWTRKALDSFRRAQQLNPKKMRYQDLVHYLSGDLAVPLPEVTGEVAEFSSARGNACWRRSAPRAPSSATARLSNSSRTTRRCCCRTQSPAFT